MNHHLRHRLPTVLVLVSGLVLVTSCRIGVATGDPEDPVAVVLGDSLVYNAEGNDGAAVTDSWLLTDALAADGWYSYVSGWIGASIQFTHDHLWHQSTREALGPPDALVLAVGTNDMGANGTEAPAVPLETARSQYEALLAEVPAGTCVRMVGVAENVAGNWRLDLWGPPYNQMLMEVAAEATHLEAEYVAWEPELAWLPGWTEGQEFGTDPHTLPAGDVAYRELLIAAADSCRA
jgi:hypothetical protein